jgi:hypothetical protein
LDLVAASFPEAVIINCFFPSSRHRQEAGSSVLIDLRSRGRGSCQVAGPALPACGGMPCSHVHARSVRDTLSESRLALVNEESVDVASITAPHLAILFVQCTLGSPRRFDLGWLHHTSHRGNLSLFFFLVRIRCSWYSMYFQFLFFLQNAQAFAASVRAERWALHF